MDQQHQQIVKFFQDGKSKSLLLNKCDLLCAKQIAGKLLTLKNAHHPNLLEVLEINGKILVDQIRSIANFLSVTSYTAEPRIVIINKAESLNLQASNALLKCLEEPGKNRYFMLLTENPSALIKTIRSRCIYINLKATRHIKQVHTKAQLEILEAIKNFDSNPEVFLKTIERYLSKKSLSFDDFVAPLKYVVHEAATKTSQNPKIAKNLSELYFAINKLASEVKVYNLSASNNALVVGLMVSAALQHQKPVDCNNISL